MNETAKPRKRSRKLTRRVRERMAKTGEKYTAALKATREEMAAAKFLRDGK